MRKPSRTRILRFHKSISTSSICSSKSSTLKKGLEKHKLAHPYPSESSLEARKKIKMTKNRQEKREYKKKQK